MKNAKKTNLALIALLSALLFSFTIISNVFAQETNLKAVAPAEIGPPGEAFTVSIVAENIPSDNGMFGWEIILTWQAGKVNCTLETLNYDIWGSGNYLGPWVTNPIDNVNGKYWQSLTGKAPGTPVSGTYWLVNLTFIVIAEPCNNVTFTFELPQGYTQYCLLNIASEEIPHTYEGVTPHVVSEFTSVFAIAAIVIPATLIVLTKRLRKQLF